MLGLIDNLGFGEFMIVAVVALLVFGKRLPQVAGQAGAQIGKLRRAIDTLWRETGVEREIRSVQREMQNVIPRGLSIGEMARMASEDVQRSLRESESHGATQTVARSTPTTVGAPVATSGEATGPSQAETTALSSTSPSAASPTTTPGAATAPSATAHAPDDEAPITFATHVRPPADA